MTYDSWLTYDARGEAAAKREDRIADAQDDIVCEILDGACVTNEYDLESDHRLDMMYSLLALHRNAPLVAGEKMLALFWADIAKIAEDRIDREDA